MNRGIVMSGDFDVDSSAPSAKASDSLSSAVDGLRLVGWTFMKVKNK